MAVFLSINGIPRAEIKSEKEHFLLSSIACNKSFTIVLSKFVSTDHSFLYISKV